MIGKEKLICYTFFYFFFGKKINFSCQKTAWSILFFFNPNKNWNFQIINRFHEFYRGSSKLIFRLISNFIMSYNVKVLGPKFTKIRLWIYTQTNHLFSLNAIKILLQNGAHLASATVPWQWLFFCPTPKVWAKVSKPRNGIGWF